MCLTINLGVLTSFLCIFRRDPVSVWFSFPTMLSLPTTALLFSTILLRTALATAKNATAISSDGCISPSSFDACIKDAATAETTCKDTAGTEDLVSACGWTKDVSELLCYMSECWNKVSMSERCSELPSPKLILSALLGLFVRVPVHRIGLSLWPWQRYHPFLSRSSKCTRRLLLQYG